MAVTNRALHNMESDLPITSVGRLLAGHDRQFIIDAYQAVLGRIPDVAGEAHYLARLRAGTHKLSILKQLRRSREGQAFSPGVAGLDRAIRNHERATLPLIGVLVQLCSGTEGNSATHRHLRSLANEIGRLGNEQALLATIIRRNAQSVTTEMPATPVAATMAAGLAPLRPATPAFIGAQRDGLAGYFQTRIWNR